MEFITIDNVLAVIVAAHSLALAIVNLTPTPKDNEIVATWYSWIEVAAGVINPKAKE